MMMDVDTAPAGQKYVDHPAPSVAIMVINLTALAGIGYALVFRFGEIARGPAPYIPLAFIMISLIWLGFYFWPLYSTYYTLGPSGLVVRYGPWTRAYAYSDFVRAYWKKGLIGKRIGWPSITPCVRLTNAVLLKRRSSWFDLCLTPNDPKAFLDRLSLFAPELTKEAIF